MASWYPQDRRRSDEELHRDRDLAQDNGYSRCSCGRQYDTLLHEQLGVCESCDIDDQLGPDLHDGAGFVGDEAPGGWSALIPTSLHLNRQAFGDEKETI